MQIDWTKVAEPQSDGSDTEVALALAAQGRYAPQFNGGAPVVAGALIWPDGKARWLLDPGAQSLPSPDFGLLPADDAIVQQGISLLQLWPAIQAQCSRILAALSPLTLVPPGMQRGGGHGCSCGQYRDDFGWIYVTADEPWGFAEGIVHEMAHWKLRGIGILFEEWTDLILANSPTELYESPVRKDIPRPMGAVLHGQYSYVHVATMTTLTLRQKGSAVDDQDRDWLALHLKRITEGQATVRAHARGTPEAGAPFLAGLDEWTSRVIREGHAALEASK